MECTTGLTDDEFDELLAWLREEGVEGYPPILGLSGSLTATLMYMRQNIVQAVIGEFLGVSQPTVSRAIKALTGAISRTLAVLLLTAEEVPEDCDYVVDGTLFPCWDWRDRRDLWSVKRGRAGMNVQILVRLEGGLVWASDPYPGSMHDVAALDASGLLEGMDPSGWIGDKGYVGRGMITPHKKPPNGELDEKAKEENRSVNRIRQAERAHHRPHQILENPPHRLPPTPAHIRADHHRSTRTLCLQNHPLNNLHVVKFTSRTPTPPHSESLTFRDWSIKLLKPITARSPEWIGNHPDETLLDLALTAHQPPFPFMIHSHPVAVRIPEAGLVVRPRHADPTLLPPHCHLHFFRFQSRPPRKLVGPQAF